MLPVCLLGALNSLSFAPTAHGGWLELPVFAVLFVLLQGVARRREAFALGLAFGFGHYVSGAYWLYISMHDYGGMPLPLAGGALILFSLYLALYPALACGAWAAGRPRRSSGLAYIGSAMVFGAAWALSEWLRATVFTGFPWLSAGYAQVDGPLGGYAAIVGVNGVGFAVAASGALLGSVLCALIRMKRRADADTNASLSAAPPSDASSSAAPLKPISSLFAPLIVLMVLLVAGGVTARWRFALPAQPPLTVRLLQGNIPQDMKFDPAQLQHSLSLYRQMILAHPADLIVTPETALPILIDNTPADFARAVRTFVDNTGSAVLLGAAGVTEHDGRTGYTNSVYGVSPRSGTLFRYDKHHLVPFGEFVPWGFRWFVNLMHIPLGDFDRGAPVQAPFIVKGERFSVNICYEDIFGDEIARSLREQSNPASILVNSSNLGWFGNTIALDQHLQIARMRALETQRPIISATNTGITAVIDAYGHVSARLPVYTVGSLDSTVQGTVGLTPYVRFGDLPILTLSLAILLIGVFLSRRRAIG